jgi:hypothetical protein
MHIPVTKWLMRGAGARAAQRKGWHAAALLVAGALALAGCGLFEPTHTYRYRMTVEVDTPEGLRTGSVVREFMWQRQQQFATSSEFIYEQRGEAAAVELPGGRVLFALLDTNPQTTILNGFHAEDRPSDIPRVGTLLERAKASGATYTFPMQGGDNLERLPQLVTFRNIADPTSVELVDPANLAASFGEGVKLRRITVQLTDDPVTTGIEKRFPDPIYKGFFNWNGDLATWNSKQAIGLSDFSQGVR